MRFSPGLCAALTGRFFSKAIAGRGNFPLVFMLEPTHRCNLCCAGCDRIRLYEQGRSPDLTLEDCLAAVSESGAPVVTVTGGEPLLYGHLKPLLAGLYRMRRHVYLCTNGLLAASFIDATKPDPRLTLSFHIDGMEATHDRITGRSGSFADELEAVKAGVRKGFRVWTNTSVYKESEAQEIIALFSLLKNIGVDGILVTPAFGYESVSEVFSCRRKKRQENQADAQGLSRPAHDRAPPVPRFPGGKRQMACTPWGSPTRNPLGWKSPCYLSPTNTSPRFPELMKKTDWDSYGPGRDVRCANCMVHSGSEPTAMREVFTRPRSMLRLMLWNMLPS